MTLKQAYLATKVGGVGSVLATEEQAPAVMAQAEQMQAEGLITILKTHTESQTGRRYTDLIQFLRQQ
jgi:hypothetical protein